MRILVAGGGLIYRSFKSWLFLLFLRSTLKIRGALAPLLTSSCALKASKTSALARFDPAHSPSPTSVSRLGESTGSPTDGVEWGGGWGLGAASVPLVPLFVRLLLLSVSAPYQQSIGCTDQIQSP